MIRAILTFVAVLGFSNLADAGGSSETVSIVSLSISGDTDYVLVVAPKPSSAVANYRDPYFGTCERFEVRGSFLRLKGAWPWNNSNLSRQAHLDALAYLNAALHSGRSVEFGWIGMGFVAIDAKNPCVVKSRALQVLEDAGKTIVVSFHDVV
jgi:hypothetical protein